MRVRHAALLAFDDAHDVFLLAAVKHRRIAVPQHVREVSELELEDAAGEHWVVVRGLAWIKVALELQPVWVGRHHDEERGVAELSGDSQAVHEVVVHGGRDGAVRLWQPHIAEGRALFTFSWAGACGTPTSDLQETVSMLGTSKADRNVG